MAVVVIDYETKDSRGASFEYFRKDFEVFSLSAAYRDGSEIKTEFLTCPDEIRAYLVKLAKEKSPIVAHNLHFERGVTERCYPGLKLNWYADTLRLCQLRDGGGNEFEEPILTFEQEVALELGETSEKAVRKQWYKRYGLGLEACSKRFLSSEHHDHKQEAHAWLEEHCGITTNHGGNLDKLPLDILRRYNDGDTINTLLLYESCLEYFAGINFDWTRDNVLYLDRAKMMSRAYRRGIKIDREALYDYMVTLRTKLNDVEQLFMETFSEAIRDLVVYREQKFLEKQFLDPKVKQDKTRYNRWLAIAEGKWREKYDNFTLGSNQQLAQLFIEILKVRNIQFFTKKGSPSFQASHLSQWGKGGEILAKRRKIMLVYQQCINTYILSEYDGRAHPSVKVSGTRTNRVAGGRV